MSENPSIQSRKDSRELTSEIEQVGNHSLVSGLLNTVSGLLAVLNEGRQVLVVNPAFLDFLGLDSPDEVLGLRVGEAVGCRIAAEAPDGCGTGEACLNCGASIALLAAQVEDQSVDALCTLARKNARDSEEDLLLRVRVSPITIEQYRYYFILLIDITNEERTLAQQRAFLHDLKNQVASLSGMLELMEMNDTGVSPAMGREVVDDLVREIDLQRAVVDQRGDHPMPSLSPLPVHSVVDQVLQRARSRMHGQILRREPPSVDPGLKVLSEKVMLTRVLLNMLINAIEATSPEEEIRVMVETVDDHCVRLSIQNPGVIPPDVQPRIFQRFFSTKAKEGRGLGTWTMRFLAENFLEGRVRFTSSNEEGTTFSLEIPKVGDRTN